MRTFCYEHRMGLVVAAIMAGLAGAGVRAADPGQDGSAGYAVTYSPHMQIRDCAMNMGPTGARAWMRGYQFVVTQIQEDSPAWQKLELGDVIVGANGKMFNAETNHRKLLGDTIGQAEVSGDPLRLDMLRKMKPMVVVLDLPKLGGFSPTWPDRCDKSRILLEHACQALLDVQTSAGLVGSDSNFGSYNAGLLWLASDDPKYLDAARRCAYNAMTHDYTKDMNSWKLGYGLILMSEYYLATGDDTVLPTIQQCVKITESGQMVCGSWGHGAPAGGYGALNQAGLACTLGLVLAKEAGAQVDESVLNKALGFFRRFAGLGCVPYGDHQPWPGLGSNGKDALAAVLFHVEGEDEVARLFGQSAGDSYFAREQGHTGGYLSIMWGPLGVAAAAPEKLRTFLDYQSWYYNLIHEWYGGMVLLPYFEALKRFDGSAYIDGGNAFCTGGLALVYTLPMKKLRITGAPHSVFGIDADLTGQLKEARDHYVARRWSQCDQTLASIDPATLKDEKQLRWFVQLKSARAFTHKATAYLAGEIISNMDNGAPYHAKCQLEALQTAIGASDDPDIARAAERVGRESDQWLMKGGEKVADVVNNLESLTPQTWYPEVVTLRNKLNGTPSMRPTYWVPLVPTLQKTPPTWKSKLYEPAAPLDEGWYRPGFDDNSWNSSDQGIYTRYQAKRGEPNTNGPLAARCVFVIDNLDDLKGAHFRALVQSVRTTTTRVYLNGQLIVDIERGQRGGYAKVPLRDNVFELLKQGPNVLAVTTQSQGTGNNRIDAGLDYTHRWLLPAPRPVHHAQTIDPRYLPQDVDTSMMVQNAEEDYREAITKSYTDQPIDTLLGEMGNDLVFYRIMVAQGIAGKGREAIVTALSKLDDPDWRVRATAVRTMIEAQKVYENQKDGAGIAFLKEQFPLIERRLEDEDPWIRNLACQVFTPYGSSAKQVGPQLAKVAVDPDPWVRESAVEAMNKVGVASEVMLDALIKATQERNTSGQIQRRALNTVKEANQSDPQKRLALLVEMVNNPPELSGSEVSAAIKLGYELDPQGKTLIPLLIKAVEDPDAFGNSGGNPRLTAIETLGKYGKLAAAAVGPLNKLLADDTDPNAKLHEPARAALTEIQGNAKTSAN